MKIVDHVVHSLWRSAIATSIIVALLSVSSAQVMTSDSYQIQSDSVNFGGGLSTSSNYTLESTGGEVATGPSDSASYRLRAGYQQMQEVFISITNPTDVEMNPTLGGLTGGTANGSTSVVVTTDSPSGYQLTILTSNDPAMNSNTDSIADYVPAGAAPDVAFSYGASEAFFGFSAAGADTATRFLYNAGSCDQAGGTPSTTACWDGLDDLNPISIAQSTNPNQPSGATTTIYFRVGLGSSVGPPPGDYYATSTLTAVPL